jgi:hypothetical protein
VQAQRWPEAIAAARAVALEGDADATGARGALLYLRALAGDPRGATPPLPATADADVAALDQRYCAVAAPSAELCAKVRQVDCDLARLRAEEPVRAADRLADRDRDAGRALYEQAGERYVAIWKKHGEAPIRAGKAPTCAHMEEVLYNARKGFQAARQIPRALDLGRVLVDPANRLHTTALARRTLYEIGATNMALGEYAEAAAWYERYAREAPKEQKADEALLDATVLRLGTGGEREAIADAELYIKNYGAARPAMTARIAFAIGAHFVEGERWEEAAKRLGGAMKRIDKDAGADVRVQAHALYGRALDKRGKAREAAGEYRLAIQLGAQLTAQSPRSFGMAQQSAFDERALAKALAAVGEARTYFAMEALRAAEAVKLPPPPAKRNAASVERWLRQDLAPAVEKRRAAIEKAEKLFLEVTRIEPMPPPRWVVHAAAAVARMWASFADETAGLGASAKKGDPLRAAAEQAARESLRPRARAAAQACVQLAVKWQYGAAESQGCAAWLSKDDRRAYPPLDELAPKPRWLGTGTAEREEALPDPRR